jgi:hypothetical protein
MGRKHDHNGTTVEILIGLNFGGLLQAEGMTFFADACRQREMSICWANIHITHMVLVE